MLQHLIIAIIFSGALFYIGRLGYLSLFKAKSGCASSCGKCGAIDFAKIEEQIKNKTSA